MKIWEAIAMLEQMDQNKECTVTFGQPKASGPYPGMPYHTPYWLPGAGDPIVNPKHKPQIYC